MPANTRKVPELRTVPRAWSNQPVRMLGVGKLPENRCTRSKHEIVPKAEAIAVRVGFRHKKTRTKLTIVLKQAVSKNS